MNIAKTTIIIALATIATLSTLRTATANDSTSNTSNIYLSKGSDFNFKVFMNKTAKRFIRKNNEEWVTFNKVVRLYNDSTGKFLIISETEKSEFFEATTSIKAKLNKMSRREAQVWLKKVDVTEKVFSFLWNNRIQEMPLENNFELPVLEIESTVGR